MSIRGLLLVAVSFLAYLPGLSAGWHYDDRPGILENSSVRNPEAAWKDLLRGRSRSLTTLSFALNRRVSPGVLGFHLVNLAIHAANASLVCALAYRLGLGSSAAFLAGMFFALHPLQTQAVTYIVQRSATLGAFFHLLAAMA